MKLFKNIKDGKIYMLVELKPGKYVALPIEVGSPPINDCIMNDFVPVSNKK
jgi:hypothetical protein